MTSPPAGGGSGGNPGFGGTISAEWAATEPGRIIHAAGTTIAIPRFAPPATPVFASAEPPRPDPGGVRSYASRTLAIPGFPRPSPPFIAAGEPPGPSPGLTTSTVSLATSMGVYPLVVPAIIACAESPRPEPGRIASAVGPTLTLIHAIPAVVASADPPEIDPGSARGSAGRWAPIPPFSPPASPRADVAEDEPPAIGRTIFGIGRPPSIPRSIRPPVATIGSSEEPSPYGGSAVAAASRTASIPPFAQPPRGVLASAEGPPPDPGRFFWPSISTGTPYSGGGYRIFSNSGHGDPIDYGSVVTTLLGFDDTTWTTFPLAVGTWKFAVRAFDSFGEEQNLSCSVTIVIGPDGTDVSNVPMPPTGLRAFATPGGGIRVEWWSPLVRGPTTPTGFRVFIGTTGTPDYASPVATVSYASGVFNAYVCNLNSLINGTVYSIGVRACNASGVEQNENFVNVTADSVGPSAVVGLTASAIV